MLSRLRDRGRREDGWALVTAMILLTVMLGSTLALVTFMDTQSTQTRKSRNRETSFNLAEAALNAQVFALSQQWPGQAYPYPTCTPATGTDRCPSDASLQALFPTRDTETGAVWETRLVDNTPPYVDFYSDALIAPGFPTQNIDKSGAPDGTPDGKMWVRAQATVRNRIRTVVAQVRLETLEEEFPHAALLAGRFTIDNNGHKEIINAEGGSAESGLVAVRCDIQEPDPVAPCAGHELGQAPTQDEDKLDDLLSYQVEPNVVQDQWTGTTQALSNESLTRLENTAKTYGTHYVGFCPPSIVGAVVWIDVPAGTTCKYTGNATLNSAEKPGVIIMAGGGVLELGGKRTCYCVLFHLNRQGDPLGSYSGIVIDLQGDILVQGGVIVDGNGGVSLGSSGNDFNIKVDDRGFSAVRSIATAGIVQNTWRELIGAK